VIAFKHNRRDEPIIPMRPEARGRLLFLPLCPSTNDRQLPVRRGRRAVLVNTRETNEYIASVGAWLRAWVHNTGFTPIATWTRIQYWLILRTTAADPSNYGKVLWDALQAGGVVANDRYVLPDNRGVGFDAKMPMIIVQL